MFAINPATKEMMEYAKREKLPKGDEIAIIPADKFKFPVNMGVFGNKVGFVSMEGEFGIIIESTEIADTIRNSFDLSWEEAKRLDKTIRQKK